MAQSVSQLGVRSEELGVEKMNNSAFLVAFYAVAKSNASSRAENNKDKYRRDTVRRVLDMFTCR